MDIAIVILITFVLDGKSQMGLSFNTGTLVVNSLVISYVLDGNLMAYSDNVTLFLIYHLKVS